MVERPHRLSNSVGCCYLVSVTLHPLLRTRRVVASCAGVLALVLGSGAAAAQSDADPIAGWLESHGELSSLASALATIGLLDGLGDCAAEPLTVLAPNDTAFTSIAGELGVPVEELLADAESLEQILTHHVVEGTNTLDDLVATGYNPTLHGDDLEVFADEDLVILDGYATVLEADLTACNGVVHVIDSVLVPADFVLNPVADSGEDAEFDDDGNVVGGDTQDGGSDNRGAFLVLSVLALGAGIGMVNMANRRRPG